MNKFFSSINEISNNGLNNKNMRDFFNSGKNLLENTCKKSKIKDSFKTYYYEPTTTLICFLKSEKTQTSYHLLYDMWYNKITFFTYIKKWENIKNIKDSFWTEFLNVSSNCGIKFNADSGPFYDKEKTPEFNSNYKSIMFNIMSVYITAMLESKEDRKNISFGQLEITWETENKSIEDIITEINIAFKIFYKFNYNLWKVEDIRRQNKNNRNKK